MGTISYKVIYANTLRILEEQVNEAINEGWQPQGGIEGNFINHTPIYNGSFFQAMIKLHRVKPEKIQDIIKEFYRRFTHDCPLEFYTKEEIKDLPKQVADFFYDILISIEKERKLCHCNKN